MKDTKVEVKSKVRVSPRLAVGVTLLLFGVILGSYLLSVATATCTTDNCNVVTELTTEIQKDVTWLYNTLKGDLQWNYVYGPDKRDFTTLYNGVKNGADLKISEMNIDPMPGSYPFKTMAECDKVLYKETASSKQIICYVGPVYDGHINNSMTIEGMSISLDQQGTISCGSNTVKVSDGSLVYTLTCVNPTNLKFYLRK